MTGTNRPSSSVFCLPLDKRLVWVFTLTCSSFFSIPLYAAVSAWVDSHQIDETQSFELVLRSDRPGTPDFTVLEKDFRILTTRTSSQISSINGRVESRISWSLILKPKTTGTLTIPPIRLNGEQSQPLTIEVKPLDQATKRIIDDLVFFESDVSPDSVYVQSQLIYVRRLFYANGVQLYGDMPARPDIPDAIVLPLGDTTTRSEVRNGRRYGVIEQRFAIFPEYSGELIIPSVSVTGSARLSTSGYSNRRRTQILVNSSPRKIQVLGIPTSYPAGKPWFPATNVTLGEVWESELKVGEPTQRNLIVRAESAVASMIPPLNATYPPSIKSYPESPSLDDFHSTEGITGVRTEAASLVLTQSGEVRIPGISLTWWDTKNHQLRESHIQARVLKIQPSDIQPDVQPNLGTTTREKSVPQKEPVGDSDSSGSSSSLSGSIWNSIRSGAWSNKLTAISAVFGLMLLLVSGGWWLRRTVFQGSASAGFHSQSTKEPQGATGEAQLYKALTKAARSKNVREFKEVLQKWLPVLTQRPLDEALGLLRQNPTTSRHLDALNAALYGSVSAARQDSARHCDDLLQPLKVDLKRFREQQRNKAKKTQPHLAELYPSLRPDA